MNCVSDNRIFGLRKFASRVRTTTLHQTLPFAHQPTMSYIFPDDDFNSNTNHINSSGPAYFMAAGTLKIPTTDPPDAFGGNARSFDDIDWEDLSLYTMPLSKDELEAINTGTSTLADPSPDADESAIPSRTPSPEGNLRSDPLHNANSSTWAARNPTHATIHPRTPPHRLSDAQKASRKIKRDQKTEASKDLHNALTIHLDGHKMKIDSLARAHNVTPKYIDDLISNHTKFHTSRKVQLSNALVHAKAKEMNSDQLAGSRYTLVELRKMVDDDSRIKKLTKDEKASYITALEEHRKQKVASVRGNNIAAARDVLLTTERIVKELNDLRVRTGTYATLFVVHGHVNDTIQSSMHGTDNSEDFWEDVYDLPMADYLRQYEQWACTQNQNLNERDSLELVRKQVRKLIIRGLISVTGKKDIAMNYKNYKTAVVETYAVQLIGWPSSIQFVSNIRKLRDALKARTCYWAPLTSAEVKAHTAELDTRRSAGEVVRQPRKKRSNAGVSRKRKPLPIANKENDRPPKKVKRNSAGHHDGPKSAEFIESSDEEEAEDS
ncbi:uncharacterized protein F5891DRAFT_986152 [Suillus fuscotomentosus]|uniref:Uncharacterized protein n=1 Tax=Suillus fuscotomentosus TaxID=1912939 RepID=A0AAD4DST1_9AGAM|nr:uncharacterized protein F5891DRAFT_986152 [Suillus fuscotomentosus]KAG1893162.1 hypothetical protein F5891DRAFT_986152 [Suillus fuscotomentosus]